MDELARLPPSARPKDPAPWLREHISARRYFTTFQSFRVLLTHAMLSIERLRSPASSTSSEAPALPPIVLLVFDCLRDLSLHFTETTYEVLWTDHVCVEFASAIVDLFSAICTSNCGAGRSPDSDSDTSLAVLQLLHGTRNSCADGADAGSLYGAVTRLAVSIAQGRYLRALFEATKKAVDNTASLPFPASSIEVVLPVVPCADGVPMRNAPIDEHVRDLILTGDAVLNAARLSDLLPLRLTLIGPSGGAGMRGELNAAGRSLLRLRPHESEGFGSPSCSSLLHKLTDPLAAMRQVLATELPHLRQRIALLPDPLLDFSQRCAVMPLLADGRPRCTSLLFNHLVPPSSPSLAPPLILVLPVYGNCGGYAPSFADLFGSVVATLLATVFTSWRPQGLTTQVSAEVPKKAVPKKEMSTTPGQSADSAAPKKEKSIEVAAAMAAASAISAAGSAASAGVTDNASYFSLEGVVDSCFMPVFCQRLGADAHRSSAPATPSDVAAPLALLGLDAAISSAAPSASPQLAGIGLLPHPTISSAATSWVRGLAVGYSATHPGCWNMLRDAPLPFVAQQILTLSPAVAAKAAGCARWVTCATQWDSFHGEGTGTVPAPPPVPSQAAAAFLRALLLLAKLGLPESAPDSPSKSSSGVEASASSVSVEDRAAVDFSLLRHAVAAQLGAIVSNPSKSVSAWAALQKLESGDLKRIKQVLASF